MSFPQSKTVFLWWGVSGSSTERGFPWKRTRVISSSWSTSLVSGGNRWGTPMRWRLWPSQWTARIVRQKTCHVTYFSRLWLNQQECFPLFCICVFLSSIDIYDKVDGRILKNLASVTFLCLNGLKTTSKESLPIFLISIYILACNNISIGISLYWLGSMLRSIILGKTISDLEKCYGAALQVGYPNRKLGQDPYRLSRPNWRHSNMAAHRVNVKWKVLTYIIL